MQYLFLRPKSKSTREASCHPAFMVGVDHSVVVMNAGSQSRPSQIDSYERRIESIALLIFVLFRCFNRQWMRGGGVGQKVLFREIAFFSSWDFSRSNKHDTFWHVISPGYFYVLFLWAIVVSVFLLLEIYENFSLPLFAITFTVNRHADISIYLKYYTIWRSVFFIKIHVKFFIFIRTMVYRRKALYRKK